MARLVCSGRYAEPFERKAAAPTEDCYNCGSPIDPGCFPVHDSGKVFCSQFCLADFAGYATDGNEVTQEEEEWPEPDDEPVEDLDEGGVPLNWKPSL